MRRFLPLAVIATLAALAATPVQAGYLIIRVLLEGGGGAAVESNDLSGGLGGPGGYGPGYTPMGGGSGPYSGSGSYRPGMPSMPGMPGMPGGAPGGTTTKPATSDPSRSIVVVIPVTSDLTVTERFDMTKPGNLDTNPTWKPILKLNHRGLAIRTHLFADSSTVQWYENLLSTPAYRRTYEQELKEKHAAWSKTKSDSATMYDTIVSALARGYVDLAVTFADDLVAAVGEKTDGLRPEIATFVKTYKSMQSAVKATPDKPSVAATKWQSMLSARNVLTRGHYAILYWDTPVEEVQRRAALLEENFRAFCLLHALRGVELNLPESPLVAVLPKRGADVRPIVSALDAPTALRVDGAYSPEHDVLVLSPERLDGVGQTFVRQAQQVYQGGVSRELLLTGKGPKVSARGADGGKKPDEVAWMQTMALVERFVDEDSAVAAVSREGSRQLLYATGQLPRYVQLPQWLQSGVASGYARPRDPAFVSDEKGKWFVAIAPTSGYGGPNSVLQRYLRDLEEKKELNPDRAQLLKNVLSDAYFHGLRNPREANDPDPKKVDPSDVALFSGGTKQPGAGGFMGPPGGGVLGPPSGYGSGGGRLPGLPGAPDGGGEGGIVGAQPVPAAEDPVVKLRKSRERLLVKSEATAWALCYYLERERPKEFRRFLDEIAAMPRDLPLDGAAVTATFLRAFKLADTPEVLSRFADGWLGYMNRQSRASQDIALVEPKAATSSPGGGSLPGVGPGGGPPGGGN